MKTLLPRVSCIWLRQHQSRAPSVCSYTTDKTRGENCKGAPKYSHQISLQSVSRTFYTEWQITYPWSRVECPWELWPEGGGGHEADGGEAADGGQDELTQPQPHHGPVSLERDRGQGRHPGPGQETWVAQGGARGGVSGSGGHSQ